MKILRLTLLLSLFSMASSTFAASLGKWELTLVDNGIMVAYQGQMMLSRVSTEYQMDGKLVSSSDYAQRKTKVKNFKDAFGVGRQLTVTYSDSRKPSLIQTFRIYKQYILVDARVVGKGMIKTNQIAPIVSALTGDFIRSNSQRTLFVPFDNDAWIRYRSMNDTSDTLRSYEVTTVYNPISRKGFVIGAINHDIWKNSIDFYHHSSNLKAISGVADKLTRDSKEHGYVQGQSVKSATFMVGVFDDWRTGMETFGDANAIVAKPYPWNKAVPVGWNSWGALAFRVNHQNSCEVSQFIADNLQNNHFHNSEGLVYTGLDSGWNQFTDAELTDFAKKCEANGQVPCIYWTPFTDWGKKGDAAVNGVPGVKYKDIWLYANGKPQELDGAYAIDPTHPAVRRMMELTAEKFRRCGFKYVKMDFMTHGRMEADKWYDKNITTGTEAYNYGMHLLDSIFHGMYINLSISPIFPAQYAQSRRIACDAWNKIKDTEYTLNALSWGWWIDRVYDYNDADHVVLREAEEGENRARVTSSAITGIFITGDDFSKGGTDDVKRRAKACLTNEGINKIVTGKAFRPLNGNDDKSENIFIRHEADGSIYLACFNYGGDAVNISISPERIGILNDSAYEITELWRCEKVLHLNRVSIPARDVKVFYLKKK